MEPQTMFDLAQRITRAPNNDARMQELMELVSNRTLSRFGVAHRTSALSMVLSLTGAVAIGAILGAGTALLLAPTSGKELQTKLRGQAQRLSRSAKKASNGAAARVAPDAHLDGSPPASAHTAAIA